MTDNEIIKALECCMNGHCNDNCPFRETRKNCYDLDSLILDLINRLKADNKELNKEVDRLSQVVMYNEGITEMKVTEAYKEFAERLCEDRVSNDPVVISAKCLLNELVGEANA